MNLKLNESKKDFPILQVIKSFLSVNKKGTNYWAICPFHEDSAPSLSISESKNIFKCFSCNVGGNAVNFVMKYTKCNYVEAVNKICEILGWDATEFLSEKDNKEAKLFKLNKFIADIYHKYLFNANTKKYLDFLINNRQLTLEIIKKYNLGFAPKEDILEPIIEQFNKINNNKKFETQELEEIGIFIKEIDQRKTPFFSSRIIFPICNKNNQVIGFSGRSIEENVKPKYLNSKSSEIFSKQNSLFNIQNLEKNKKIFLYEGFFDLLNSEKVGINNGLALMGANLDASFFLKLKNYSQELVLVFDNDDTGKNLSIKVFENAIEYGFSIEIISFLHEKYKDIDEFLKINPQEAIKTLKNPINFFEWFYEYWKIENKNLDFINLHLLINKSLEFLFFKHNNEVILKPNISIEYAKKCLKIIFNFYTKFPEFTKPEYQKIINKKQEEYEKIIMKNLIQKDNIEEIQIFPEKEEKYDISQYTVLKYRTLLEYLKKNISKILKKFEIKDWFFKIDEEFLFSEFSKPFFSIFNKLINKENITKEEEEYWSKLKSIRFESVLINRIGEFFNEYFTFNKEYLNDFLTFIKQKNFLETGEENIALESATQRYIKKEKIRNLLKKNKNILKSFKNKYSFLKKSKY